MQKLTRLQTIRAEWQEAVKAKRAYRLQAKQYNKRLGYVPVFIKYLVLIIVTTLMMLTVAFTGVVVGSRGADDCICVKCIQMLETGAG